MALKKTFLFSVLFIFGLVVFILTSGRNNERAGRLVVDVKGYIKYRNVTRTVNTRSSSHFVHIKNDESVTKTIKTMKANTSNSSQFVHIEEKITTTVKPTTSNSSHFVKLNLENNTLSTRQRKCADAVCSNFLTTSKMHCAKTIKNAASIKPATKVCHFQNGTMKRRVLLRTFPGSGNTWTRQLLEKSSGICTGN